MNYQSFHSLLVHYFRNRTLFNFLLNDHENVLDKFKLAIRCNFPAFDANDVLTAFHKATLLKEDLIQAKRMIVINPFLSASDSDSDDSGL